MQKPENPYRPRCLKWALFEEDWSDLTVVQIAEVFDVKKGVIQSTIFRIKQETGYSVPYKHVKPGRKRVPLFGNRKSSKPTV